LLCRGTENVATNLLINLSPEKAKRAREEFAGKFGGIGVIIFQKDNRIVVKELVAARRRSKPESRPAMCL